VCGGSEDEVEVELDESESVDASPPNFECES
jgi:hypothetical protein